jgi:hypothetical protein
LISPGSSTWQDAHDPFRPYGHSVVSQYFTPGHDRNNPVGKYQLVSTLYHGRKVYLQTWKKMAKNCRFPYNRSIVSKGFETIVEWLN